jgi:hypothetical protein
MDHWINREISIAALFMSIDSVIAEFLIIVKQTRFGNYCSSQDNSKFTSPHVHGGVGGWEVPPKKLEEGGGGQLMEICMGHPLSGTCLKPDIPEVSFMGNGGLGNCT